MITFNHISKRFLDQDVLTDFSYTILPGDKVNITGRSGIGKTTLFKLLLGFVQPDAGSIHIHKQLLDERSVWSWRKQVAYISQDVQIGTGKVIDFFEDTLALKANQHLKDHVKDSMDNLLHYFELPSNILQNQIEALSGGEKQRIATINAVFLNRSVFMLDEITSALDPELKDKTMQFFLLNKAYTVLFISHDQYKTSETTIKTIRL